MGKTVDVDLRIRAKNLSKSSLAEINADVERLTQAQTAQAKASDLAARSVKELVAEQTYLAAASRELARRSNLAEQFSKERIEIEKTSTKIKELTELRKRAAANPAPAKSPGQNMGALDKEITRAEKELARLATTNKNTANTLRALGVDTDNVEVEMRQLSAAAAQSGTAYKGAVDDVARYGQAVEHNNAILAEAARRTKELTGGQIAARRAAGQRNEATSQTGQLAALRADIQARSDLARVADISAEAQRRAGVEAAQAAKLQAAAEVEIRKSINAYVGAKNARLGLVQAFQATQTAQEKEAGLNARLEASQAASNDRKARLIALLKTERGQRILNAEATDKDTGATNRNAAATGRAAKEQQLFADTGRKSLSVYQRIRGQVLGLAAAYIGVYQVIGTFNNALEAVNRNQALTIGLKTVNNGDAVAAAADYKFLREEANRLGLVFDDIAPKFAGMSIAGKAVGLTGKQIRDAFTNVAESVAAGNLSIEDSDGVFRAVVQVMSKARVQAEELRGQLGDRLPGAVAAFAKANNIALTDLDEHLKKGKGNIDQFLKFLQAYSSQYAPTLDEATTRLQANINRAKNAYNDWLRQLLSSSNQTALKGAFKAIEEFFAGQQGIEFAEKLGKAFKFVVDVFMWVADNISVAEKALKAFLLIQATKFAIDMANAMKNLAVQIAAVGAASTASGGKVGAFAGSLGRVKAVGLGVAGILAGITIAINGQTEAAKNATTQMTRYIDAMSAVAGAKSLEENTAAWDGIQGEIKNTEEEVRVLQKTLEDTRSWNPIARARAELSKFSGEAKEVGIGNFTTDTDIEERLNASLKRQGALREALKDLIGQQIRLRRDLREEEEKPTVAVVETEEKKKAKKGPDLEQIARNRADAERAVADKIIEIQDDIAKAKIDSEAKTEAQIEANYDATLERIKLKIAETRNDIAKLQQNSEKAGVDNSAGFTQADGLLINLEAQLEKKAEYDRLSGLIELKESRINDLISARDAKLQLINTQVQLGTMTQLEGYVQANLAQDEYNAKIQTEIAAFQTLVSTIQQGGPLWMALGLDETIAKFAQVNVEAKKLTNTELFKKNFFPQIAQGAANAFVVLGQGLAQAAQGAGTVEDAFKAAGDAFLTFAADFLQQIAQMIIQQAILNALQGNGGTFQQIIGQAFGATGHTGGTVKSGKIGSGNAVRKISPLTFAAGYAGTFHEGGMPGLKTGEVTAILKKREEVVTADDPRNVLNGGMSGGSQPDITVINTTDSASVVQQGWQSTGTMRVVLNSIRANKGAFKQALGIK